MGDPQPLHLRLEVDRDAEPIGGVVADDAVRRRFHGWLELMAALDDLREAGARPQPQGPGGPA